MPHLRLRLGERRFGAANQAAVTVQQAGKALIFKFEIPNGSKLVGFDLPKKDFTHSTIAQDKPFDKLRANGLLCLTHHIDTSTYVLPNSKRYSVALSRAKCRERLKSRGSSRTALCVPCYKGI